MSNGYPHLLDVVPKCATPDGGRGRRRLLAVQDRRWPRRVRWVDALQLLLLLWRGRVVGNGRGIAWAGDVRESSAEPACLLQMEGAVSAYEMRTKGLFVEDSVRRRGHVVLATDNYRFAS